MPWGKSDDRPAKSGPQKYTKPRVPNDKTCTKCGGLQQIPTGRFAPRDPSKKSGPQDPIVETCPRCNGTGVEP